MPGADGTLHNLKTQLFAIAGDEAHVESDCLFHISQPDGGLISSCAARYVDRFERRDGRWAIATCIALIDFGQEAEHPG